VLILFTPDDIEGFVDYGRSLADDSAPSDEMLIEEIAALGPVYGIELLARTVTAAMIGRMF